MWSLSRLTSCWKNWTSAMTAAATMAVAVMDSFLMPFMLIFFI